MFYAFKTAAFEKDAHVCTGGSIRPEKKPHSVVMLLWDTEHRVTNWQHYLDDVALEVMCVGITIYRIINICTYHQVKPWLCCG